MELELFFVGLIGVCIAAMLIFLLTTRGNAELWSKGEGQRNLGSSDQDGR